MTTESYWAVAQTVTKMEHIVRRDIEKTNHGAFLPTRARFWAVDDREYSKETPLIGGYVFFLTKPDDWAGIPDIHGVYRVLSAVAIDHTGEAKLKPCRVSELEMARLVVSHAAGDHNLTDPPKFTKYYRKPTKKSARYRRRRPRPGKLYRSLHAQ
jgi:hypothetical protein